MKQTFKSLVAIFMAANSFAQVKLSGSLYQQNFDTLSLGIPEGWEIDTNAKANTLGGSVVSTFVAIPATGTRWGNTSGAFKNVASANSFAYFALGTNAAQLAASDRALAVKQTGTFGDAGAAFTFQIDNTFRLSDFEMDFKLQSLDSSAGGRTSNWQLQYAFGDHPTIFTTVDIDSTGGNSFTNKFKTISFGSALDDKREQVWIRLVTLKSSTGAGSRTTTAIDNVAIRWTGIAEPSYRPLVKNTFPSNGATSVPVGSILSIDFSRNINIGTVGHIYIKNETDNTTQIINTSSAFLHSSGKKLNIEGVQLLPAKRYHIVFDSTMVDTALATTYALEDTTEWQFKTVNSLPNSMFEYFDTACSGTNTLPQGWRKYSSIGDEEWNCTEHLPGNASIKMYGNNGSVNTINKDWLISPRLDISSADFMAINFHLFKKNSGNELSVLVSHDYAGSGTPDSATWSPIVVSMSAADVNKWMNYMISMAGHTSSPIHVAFQYNSSTSAAYELLIDSVTTLLKTDIKNIGGNQNGFSIRGYPKSAKIMLAINSQNHQLFTATIIDILGQTIYTKTIEAHVGWSNSAIEDANLKPGLYMVRLKNEQFDQVQKCIITE